MGAEMVLKEWTELTGAAITHELFCWEHTLVFDSFFSLIKWESGGRGHRSCPVPSQGVCLLEKKKKKIQR